MKQFLIITIFTFFFFFVTKAWTSWEGKIGFLEDLYVDQLFRPKGIARRFFNLVSKEVIKNGGAWLKLNGN